MEGVGLAHLYPALAWSVCAPGHHGYPRAPDLILRKALREAAWVTRSRVRRRDRFSISSIQLADLGRYQLRQGPASDIPSGRPRIVRSPVDICFGTKPSQAAKSRPSAKAAPLPMAATMALAMSGRPAALGDGSSSVSNRSPTPRSTRVCHDWPCRRRLDRHEAYDCCWRRRFHFGFGGQWRFKGSE